MLPAQITINALAWLALIRATRQFGLNVNTRYGEWK